MEHFLTEAETTDLITAANNLLGKNHKVHIYLEYNSVCPIVGIGTSPPLRPQASECALPRNRGWGEIFKKQSVATFSPAIKIL